MNRRGNNYPSTRAQEAILSLYSLGNQIVRLIGELILLTIIAVLGISIIGTIPALFVLNYFLLKS